MPRNLSEPDRKKNQFDKEERVHLLSIMKQYAPLLENSASTLARKKIWTTIEEEFKKAGFTRKTSAQLKKYWQNYKYHCKKSKAPGTENRKCDDSDTNETSEWNRYQIFVENRSTIKCADIFDALRPLPNSSQTPLRIDAGYRSTELYGTNEASDCNLNTSDSFIDLSRVKTEENDIATVSNDCGREEANALANETPDEKSVESSSTGTVDSKKKNRIVVSNAKVSNSSVTVSVIYPENNTPASIGAMDKMFEACLQNVSSSAKKSAGTLFDYYGKKTNSDTATKKKSNSISFELRDLLKEQNEANENVENRKTDPTMDNEYGRTVLIGSKECELLMRHGSDWSTEKEIKEFSKNDQCAASTDNQEGDATVRTASSDARNDSFGSRGYVFLTDYRNQLKHKLLLQQLEAEEKRLKVKIAEMTIEEVQLRIKGLREEMRRTEELHRIRVASVLARNAGHSCVWEDRGKI